MKNIKAIAICILAVFITINIAVHANETDLDNTQYKNEINLLNTLCITNIDINGFNPQVKVTRTEFSDAIMKMMYNEEYSGTSYADMTENNTGMLFLKNMNIISGNEEGQFLPNKVITLDEALKIATSVLGFSPVVDYNGGWTDGYRSIASDIDLLDGITIGYNDEITLENFIKLLLNIIDTDILSLKTMGVESKYERLDGVTLLAKYRNIYKSRGILNADDFTDIYSYDHAVGKGNVAIDGNVYISTYENAEKYLGYYVQYYYNDKTNELIYAEPYKSVNDTLTVKSDDILAYSNGTYTYGDKTGKTKTIDINAEMSIIYNGVFAETNDIFIPKLGDITFVDNNNDGKYNVLFINDVSITIAEYTDYDKKHITDKYDGSFNINLFGCGGYRIRDEKGTKKELSEILQGDILEVKKSASGNFYEIKIVKNIINGTVNYITEKSDKYDKIGIEEEYSVSYRFNDLVDSRDQDIIKIGSDYTIYLTSDDKIIYMTNEVYSTDRVGYVRKFIEKDENNDENPKVKILDQTGNWEIYNLADSIKLNGSRVKSKNVSANNMKTNTVCKYSLNFQGDITSIDFPDENSDSLITTFSDTGAMLKKLNIGYSFGKNSGINPRWGYINPEATVFVIPNIEDETNSDDCYRTAVAITDITISGSNLWDIDMYNLSGEKAVSDVALIRTSDKYGFVKSNKRKPVVINKIYQGINADDEFRYVMNVMSDGSEVNVMIDDRRTDKTASLPFGSGDVIFYSTSSNGELVLHDDEKSYAVLLNYDEGNFIMSQTNSNAKNRSQFDYGYNTTLNSSFTERFGAVYKTDGDMIFVNCLDDITDETGIAAFNCKSSNIYVYDERINEFEKGSLSEAIGYKYDTVDYSMAYMISNESYSYLVIYP